MAKKKREKLTAAISDTKADAPEQKATSQEAVSVSESDLVSTVPVEGIEEEEEIVLSDDTLAEIGSPDKELIFKKVAGAYEEVKRKREQYKKIGPIVVFVTGVIFLTLMFTLENKITFLIIWVISVLYMAALMIRAEYKYHQFRYYLGLTDEEFDADEEPEAEEETAAEAESEEHKKVDSKKAEQEKKV